MLITRWYKVWRDLWQHKTQTILAILSIMVGVTGVGVIGQAKSIFDTGMKTNFTASHPAHITILAEPFSQELVEKVQKITDVQTVEARSTLYGRINAAKDDKNEPNVTQWKSLHIFAASDLHNMQLNKLYLQNGKWPTQSNELVVERTSLSFLHAKVGDYVWIDVSGDQKEKFQIVGTVFDPFIVTSQVSGSANAYTTLDTLKARKLANSVNTLYIEAKNPSNKMVNDLAIRIRDLCNENGISVFSMEIPKLGQHWAYDMVHTSTYILEVFGILTILLGSTLIVNTITSIMMKQQRQMGVMKVIGASLQDIRGMYIVLVLSIGLFAFLLGVPLSLIAAKLLTKQSVTLLNFNEVFVPSFFVIALQSAVALILPLLAVLLPIYRRSNTPIVELLQNRTSHSSILHHFRQSGKWITRPFLLSLRNTFRRGERLLLVLLTLSLGEAMVVSAFSAEASITKTVEKTIGYAHYDFDLTFPTELPASMVTSISKSVSGITETDTVFNTLATIVRADQTKTQDLHIMAVHSQSHFIVPTIAAGHWLQPNENKQIILNQKIIHDEPYLRLGDSITLHMNGSNSNWKIAGFAVLPNDIDIIVDESDLSDVLQVKGLATSLLVRSTSSDRSEQAKLGAQVKNEFDKNGLHVNYPSIVKDHVNGEKAKYQIIIALLAGIAFILCLISIISLMSTMSMNVLDRTKEIGIIRSIGASNGQIWMLFAFESIIISIMSWMIGSILAFPIGRMISNQIGQITLQMPLFYEYSFLGVGGSFITAIVLSILASILPAWRALHISIKEVLTYE